MTRETSTRSNNARRAHRGGRRDRRSARCLVSALSRLAVEPARASTASLPAQLLGSPTRGRRPPRSRRPRSTSATQAVSSRSRRSRPRERTAAPASCSTKKGLILTNDHVIAGARSLTVAAEGSSKRDPRRDDRRRRSQPGPRADPRRSVRTRPEAADLGELELGPGRRRRVRDRQSLRSRRDAHPRHRVGARPRNICAGRLEDQRRDPDRCGAQPG